jgi:hypothetical protein
MKGSLESLPAPETMLTYASMLEKPQYVVKNGARFKIPTGEIIEAACAALRLCAALKHLKQENENGQNPPQEN